MRCKRTAGTMLEHARGVASRSERIDSIGLLATVGWMLYILIHPCLHTGIRKLPIDQSRMELALSNWHRLSFECKRQVVIKSMYLKQDL
jgi:hypothetical protein